MLSFQVKFWTDRPTKVKQYALICPYRGIKRRTCLYFIDAYVLSHFTHFGVLIFVHCLKNPGQTNVNLFNGLQTDTADKLTNC